MRIRRDVFIPVLVVAAAAASGALAATAFADFASRVHQPTERGLRSIEFSVAPPAIANNRLFRGYRLRYGFSSESPGGDPAGAREAVKAPDTFPDLAPAAASIARNYAWLPLVAGPQWLASAAVKSGAAANEKGGHFEVTLEVKADSPWRVPAGTYTLRFGPGLGSGEAPEPPGLSFRMVPTDDELRAAGVDLDAERKRREELDGARGESGRAYDGPFGGEFGWVYAAAPRSDGVFVKRSEAEGVAPARVVGYEAADGGRALRARLAPEDGTRLGEITARAAQGGGERRIAVLSGGALLTTLPISGPLGETVEIADPSPDVMAAMIARFAPTAASTASATGEALLLHRVESAKLGTIDIEYAAGADGLFLVKRLAIQAPGNALGRHTLDILDTRVNQPIDPALFATD